MKRRFSNEQIIGIIKEYEAAAKVQEVGRMHQQIRIRKSGGRY